MRGFGAALLGGLLVAFAAAGIRAEPPPAPGTGARAGLGPGGFEDRFTLFDPSRWQKTDGWSNGTFMGCGWNAANIALRDGLRLSITDRPSAGERHSCAEYRMRRPYGHGTYTVRLKAVRADGVMTMVSHYTGPPFGDPWDEITFGIAGKDTTRLEIGYVAGGVGHRGVVVDLGFDAARDFHDYAIDWQPDRIT